MSVLDDIHNFCLLWLSRSAAQVSFAFMHLNFDMVLFLPIYARK